MIEVAGWLAAEGMRSRLLMQVHDELVLEAPSAELERLRSELPPLMLRGHTGVTVPLEVEIGTGANWEEAH